MFSARPDGSKDTRSNGNEGLRGAGVALIPELVEIVR